MGAGDPAKAWETLTKNHDAARGYQIFNDKEDACVKVVLQP
ncbi:MAG: hypothetical protein U1F43_26640 [Myxococcota bacterium]